jgi:exopolyphosphatase / guanosine-5'-triphosphate,3'-diphosphate pyrophosphatase
LKPLEPAGTPGHQGCAFRGSRQKAAGAIPGMTPARRVARRASARNSEGLAASRQEDGHTYAALDLGTNNCRLLIARPAPAGGGQDGFRVIDSFSRIVRLGEGLSKTGALSAAAVARTIGALEICRDKMRARGVTRSRLVATEACRAAHNGADFLAQVQRQVGIELEVVDRETEARLAAMGSASLVDSAAEGAVLFDIGGGSCELVWLAGAPRGAELAGAAISQRIRFWVSLNFGVVTLAEQFGGIEVSDAIFEAMIDHAAQEIETFAARAGSEPRCARFHLLGTSGTVTTIAGVYLGLSRYDRRRVDGLWMSSAEVNHAVSKLRNMTYGERAANGCIGQERADLVLAGCAILEAIRRAFPAKRIRIADRGLRDGILIELMRGSIGPLPGTG